MVLEGKLIFRAVTQDLGIETRFNSLVGKEIVVLICGDVMLYIGDISR